MKKYQPICTKLFTATIFTIAILIIGAILFSAAKTGWHKCEKQAMNHSQLRECVGI